jgi:hypothetical protein
LVHFWDRFSQPRCVALLALEGQKPWWIDWRFLAAFPLVLALCFCQNLFRSDEHFHVMDASSSVGPESNMFLPMTLNWRQKTDACQESSSFFGAYCDPEGTDRSSGSCHAALQLELRILHRV